MVELKRHELVFTFAEIHPEAKLTVGFQRTLRIPDDGRDYPLPAGLGRFPVEHVDDHASRIETRWLEYGGVMLPMWQAEAMWIAFGSEYVHNQGPYPFAVKIAAGKINAVTGESWANALHEEPQDYVVAPRQPWIDGFCVERGTIRQFVAMKLGEGYTAEEQITGKAEFGGLQIVAYPMKRAAFEKRFPQRTWDTMYRSAPASAPGNLMLSACAAPAAGASMGMGLGGRMRQEIVEDPFSFDEWDTSVSSRCFVHLIDARQWQAITGRPAPTMPPTAKQYAHAGIPWFTWYDEGVRPLAGSAALSKLKSVVTLGKGKGHPIENEPAVPEKIVNLRAGLKPDQVREASF